MTTEITLDDDISLTGDDVTPPKQEKPKAA